MSYRGGVSADWSERRESIEYGIRRSYYDDVDLIKSEYCYLHKNIKSFLIYYLTVGLFIFPLLIYFVSYLGILVYTSGWISIGYLYLFTDKEIVQRRRQTIEKYRAILDPKKELGDDWLPRIPFGGRSCD